MSSIRPRVPRSRPPRRHRERLDERREARGAQYGPVGETGRAGRGQRRLCRASDVRWKARAQCLRASCPRLASASCAVCPHAVSSAHSTNLSPLAKRLHEYAGRQPAGHPIGSATEAADRACGRTVPARGGRACLARHAPLSFARGATQSTASCPDREQSGTRAIARPRPDVRQDASCRSKMRLLRIRAWCRKSRQSPGQRTMSVQRCECRALMSCTIARRKPNEVAAP